MKYWWLKSEEQEKQYTGGTFNNNLFFRPRHIHKSVFMKYLRVVSLVDMLSVETIDK